MELPVQLGPCHFVGSNTYCVDFDEDLVVFGSGFGSARVEYDLVAAFGANDLDRFHRGQGHG